jgi:hypothetical protein
MQMAEEHPECLQLPTVMLNKRDRREGDEETGGEGLEEGVDGL